VKGQQAAIVIEVDRQPGFLVTDYFSAYCHVQVHGLVVFYLNLQENFNMNGFSMGNRFYDVEIGPGMGNVFGEG
jgi:hypothetical protein